MAGWMAASAAVNRDPFPALKIASQKPIRVSGGYKSLESTFGPKTHAKEREKLVRVQAVFNTLFCGPIRSRRGVSGSFKDE
jgi:hypothetical protein